MKMLRLLIFVLGCDCNEKTASVNHEAPPGPMGPMGPPGMPAPSPTAYAAWIAVPDGGPARLVRDGSFVSRAERRDGGQVLLEFSPGVFEQTPICLCTAITYGEPATCAIRDEPVLPSAEAILFQLGYGTGGPWGRDLDFTVLCSP